MNVQITVLLEIMKIHWSETYIFANMSGEESQRQMLWKLVDPQNALKKAVNYGTEVERQIEMSSSITQL